jgi:putative SOS response-associated peptidase YedK
MPLILDEATWSDWLDTTIGDHAELERLLAVYPASEMAEHPVSTLVNKVANNYPECIEPLETAAVEQ